MHTRRPSTKLFSIDPQAAQQSFPWTTFDLTSAQPTFFHFIPTPFSSTTRPSLYGSTWTLPPSSATIVGNADTLFDALVEPLGLDCETSTAPKSLLGIAGKEAGTLTLDLLVAPLLTRQLRRHMPPIGRLKNSVLPDAAIGGLCGVVTRAGLDALKNIKTTAARTARYAIASSLLTAGLAAAENKLSSSDDDDDDDESLD